MVYDFLIIGGGISGAAAAYELSACGSTVILEAESRPGYHSTGRSAALYTPNYGPELVQRLSRLSYEFLRSPPTGFTEHPLLSPRGMLTIAPAGEEQTLASLIQSGGAELEALNSDQTLSLVPFLRPERVIGSAYEAGVQDIDVDALHQGFLRGCRQRGADIVCDSRVVGLCKSAAGWRATLTERTIEARVVVNAAGAWADVVGRMAGANPIGLVPKRRTAMLVDAPVNMDLRGMPAMDFIGVDNYIKPDADRLMISPGDESPVEPHDVQAEDLDIATLVDWLETETQLSVERTPHSWAGLRSFVADGTPVVGFDPALDGFFWLAGQGGYGIMLSSALARASAKLITEGTLPDDFIQVGIEESLLSAARLGLK